MTGFDETVPPPEADDDPAADATSAENAEDNAVGTGAGGDARQSYDGDDDIASGHIEPDSTTRS